jgi:hypothetical protein
MVDVGSAPEATDQDGDIRRWSTAPVTLSRLSAALRRLDASRATTALGVAAGLPAAGRDCHPGGDCHPVRPEVDTRNQRDLGAVN